MRSLIVAVANDNVIGRDGRLPWHLPADLQRFKQLTMGHHIVMGRKTFESIGRLLPGRTSIVLTRQPAYAARGALVVNSWPAALQIADADDEVFIIGGAEIYRQSVPFVDRVYLTTVHADLAGDTHFPPLKPSQWRLVSQQEWPADDRHQYSHTFQILDRLRASEPSEAEGCQAGFAGFADEAK